jgi:hypothetical protein
MISSAFAEHASGPGVPSERSDTPPGVVVHPEDARSTSAEEKRSTFIMGMIATPD